MKIVVQTVYPYCKLYEKNIRSPQNDIQGLNDTHPHPHEHRQFEDHPMNEHENRSTKQRLSTLQQEQNE